MDETVDRSTFCNYFLTELLYGGTPDGAPRLERALRQLQCADCKSLYDAVCSENPSSTEKRTIISMRSIQDFITEDDCRWVPAGVMWSDVLTKEDKNLCLSFHHWMDHPYAALIDEKKIYQCEIHPNEPFAVFVLWDAAVHHSATADVLMPK